MESRTALATKYGINGYTGSPTQNMALQALVMKGGPAVDNTKISGSSSPISVQNTNNGLASAANAVGATSTPTGTPAPTNKTITGSIVDPKTGATTNTYSDGTTAVVPADASVAPYYSQAQTATDQATSQYNIDKTKLDTDYQAQKKQLEEEKANALAGATSSYNTNNPTGSGSDKSEYLAGIASKYDTAITNLTSSYNSATSQNDLNHQTNLTSINNSLQSALSQAPTLKLQQQKLQADMLNTSIDNFTKVISNNPEIAKLFNDKGEITGSYDQVQSLIDTATGMGVPKDLVLPMIKSEVANAKAKQAANDAAEAKAELAQRTADRQDMMAQASLNKSSEALAYQENRDRRADETQARTEAKDVESQFLHTNTSTQALAVGQQYMNRIEAASGTGVSALGLIDALVKLDTGGQAVRQGQTDILQESGTWGDSYSRLKAKMGLSSKVGANTILTPNQVTQIKDQAKKIIQEQINSAIPAYQSAKSAVDSIKSDYPEESDKIDGYTQSMKSAEAFINKYGTDEQKAQMGLASSATTDSSTPNSDDYVTNFLKGK